LADTLTYNGPGSNTVYVGAPYNESVYTYPYYLSVNGAPSVAMMCLSFDNEITEPSWFVTESTPTSVDELEAAWLLKDAATTPANDIADQLADGHCSPPRAVRCLQTTPSRSRTVTLAGTNYGSVNAANFTIYTLTDTNSTFRRRSSLKHNSGTTSLLLLGTGLFGLAVILFRKEKASGLTSNS